MTELLLLMLAQVTADFLLQSDELAAEKLRLSGRAFWRHGVGIFVMTALLLHYTGLVEALTLAGIAAVTHIAIDFLIVLARRRAGDDIGASLAVFVIDQLAHVAVVLCIRARTLPAPSPAVLAFYRRLGELLGIGALPQPGVLPNPAWATTIALVYIYVVFGGAVFVKMVLARTPRSKVEPFTGAVASAASQHSGRYIGILERAIVLTLVLQHSYEAVAFVLAAKSVARYGELEKKMSAEYYLVGTLASVLIAALGGLILHTMAPLFQ